MQRYLLAALAVVWACGAPALAPAGSFMATGQFAGTVSPQVTGLLSQFPAGGPELRAAISRLVQTDPALADDAAFAARNASQGQKQAIGAGLADAASVFAKCSTCGVAGQRVRTAISSADQTTRAAFVAASNPASVLGLLGINAGAVPGACISPSRPGC
jgi:hypothetical protein